MAAKTVDPITFQVLRNKLEAIVSEQTIAIKQVSGSVVVTEANDFNMESTWPMGLPCVWATPLYSMPRPSPL